MVQLTLKTAMATLKKAGIKVRYDNDQMCPCAGLIIKVKKGLDMTIYSQKQLDAGNAGLLSAESITCHAPFYVAEFVNYMGENDNPDGKVRGFKARNKRELAAMTKKALKKGRGK